MKYIDKFPDMKPIFEERENIIRSNHAFPCCICGSICDYVEINYEAHFCSEECVAEMDKMSSHERGFTNDN